MPTPIPFTFQGVTPVVQGRFAQSTGDWSTLSTLSSMPTGGSISRAGQAMLYDSTGKLTYAPNNLLTYSNTFSDSSWSKTAAGNGVVPTVTDGYAIAPDGTQTAARIQFSLGAGGSSGSRLFRGGISTASALLGSIWFKTNDGSTKTLYVQSGGAPIAVTVTGTWTQFASTPGITYGQMQFGLQDGAYSGVMTSATADVLVWSAVVAAVTYETTPRTADQVITTSAAYYGPRFDYDPSTLAAKGLLIEGTRTNIQTNSNTFNTSWLLTGAPTPTQNVTGPDGVANSAWTLTPNSGSNSKAIYKLSASPLTTATNSVYAKAGVATWLGLGFDLDAKTDGAFFNLSTGAIGTVSAGATASITNVGNGWYRCSVTRTYANGGHYLTVEPHTADNQVIGWTAVGNETLLIYGAQMEAASFPTSYIPTTSASVARAAETFAITGYSTNLIEAFYIDEATGGSWSANYNAGTAPSTSFGWTTRLRVYTNAYAGDIATPSWIDNSGTTGNRMVTDSTGALTWAPANILTYSEDFSNASWAVAASGGGATGVKTPNYSGATAPDGTNTACRVQLDVSGGSAGAQSQMYKAFSLPTNIVMSAWIKTTDSSTKTIKGFSASGSQSPVNLTVTGVWTRLSSFALSSVGISNFQIMLIKGDTSDTADLLVWHPQVEPVTYQTSPRAYIPTTSAAIYNPRYDYDGSTVPATPKGMLIEESRVNATLQSNTLSNASWTGAVQGMATPVAGVTGPDGVSASSWKIAVSSASSNQFNMQQGAISSSIGATVTVSAYFKYGNTQWVTVGIFDGAWFWGCFDVVNGVNGNVSAGATMGTPVNAGSGWYRVSITRTLTNASYYVGVGLRGSNNVATPWTSNGTEYANVFGVQSEAGAFATSYIPTTTASVTRVGDVVKLTGNALTTLQSSNASAFVETGKIQTNVPILGDGPSFQIQNVTATLARSYNGTNAFNQAIGSGNYTTGNVRTGLSWDGSSRNLVANNGSVGSNSGSANWGAVAYLGSGSSLYMNGCARSLAIYNQKLPDAILKQKSVVGSSY